MGSHSAQSYTRDPLRVQVSGRCSDGEVIVQVVLDCVSPRCHHLKAILLFYLHSSHYKYMLLQEVCIQKLETLTLCLVSPMRGIYYSDLLDYPPGFGLYWFFQYQCERFQAAFSPYIHRALSRII